MTNPIVEAAIRRSRTTLLLMAMVVIAGVVARIAIPIEAAPNVEVPVFLVAVPHEGISPEDSARLLVKPLEVELRSIEGTEEVRAYAYQGMARLAVEFDADFDLDDALNDVRAAVDRARPLFPATTDEPYIEEMSASQFSIVQINLVGEGVDERVIYNLAKELRDDIEALPEVLDAYLQGEREELLEVIIDPAALEAYGVESGELLNTMVRNNRLIAAGSLDTGAGRMAVKVPSVIERAQDIFDLPVKANGDSVVTLSDIAEIPPHLQGSRQFRPGKRQGRDLDRRGQARQREPSRYRRQGPGYRGVLSGAAAPQRRVVLHPEPGALRPRPGDRTAGQYHHRARLCHGAGGCRHRPAQRLDRWRGDPGVVPVRVDLRLDSRLLVQLHGHVRHAARPRHAHRRRDRDHGVRRPQDGRRPAAPRGLRERGVAHVLAGGGIRRNHTGGVPAAHLLARRGPASSCATCPSPCSSS